MSSEAYPCGRPTYVFRTEVTEVFTEEQDSTIFYLFFITKPSVLPQSSTGGFVFTIIKTPNIIPTVSIFIFIKTPNVPLTKFYIFIKNKTGTLFVFDIMLKNMFQNN